MIRREYSPLHWVKFLYSPERSPVLGNKHFLKQTDEGILKKNLIAWGRG